jgi:hypothetical protein
MAFNANHLVRWSANPVPPKLGLPQWWGYSTTVDTIATVSAASYFNLNYGLVIGGNSTWYVGDLVYCVCSNGVVQLEITAVYPNQVTTVVNNAAIPAGSITGAEIAANTVTSANVATNLIQYLAVVGLTAVQIEGMYAAPILIMPAPPAGSMIVINDATINLTGATAAFAGGGVIALQYGNAVHGAGSGAGTGVAAATWNGFGTTNSSITMINGNDGEASANTNAAAIYLSNATAAFTGGTNSLTNLYIHYSIVPVA